MTMKILYVLSCIICIIVFTNADCNDNKDCTSCANDRQLFSSCRRCALTRECHVKFSSEYTCTPLVDIWSGTQQGHNWPITCYYISRVVALKYVSSKVENFFSHRVCWTDSLYRGCWLHQIFLHFWAKHTFSRSLLVYWWELRTSIIMRDVALKVFPLIFFAQTKKHWSWYGEQCVN